MKREWRYNTHYNLEGLAHPYFSVHSTEPYIKIQRRPDLIRRHHNESLRHQSKIESGGEGCAAIWFWICNKSKLSRPHTSSPVRRLPLKVGFNKIITQLETERKKVDVEAQEKLSGWRNWIQNELIFPQFESEMLIIEIQKYRSGTRMSPRSRQ